MSQQFLLVKARNTRTGGSLKQQDLTGARFTLAQSEMAHEQAQRFADSLTARTGDQWVPVVESYTPSRRLR